MNTISINIDSWVILDVCGTCEYAVDGGGEINDVSDARSAEALDVHWQDYHLWGDCSGDGCESEHLWMCELEGCDPEAGVFGSTHDWGHHSGGFTWSSCDVCGWGGRDSHRVIAEPRSGVTVALNVAAPHGVTAGDLHRGDTILQAHGIEDEDLPGLVDGLDFGSHGVYVKLRDPKGKKLPLYHYFLRPDDVTVMFAASC